MSKTATAERLERCEHSMLAAFCPLCVEPYKNVGTMVCHRCGSVVRYDDGAEEFKKRFFNFGSEHGDGKCTAR